MIMMKPDDKIFKAVLCSAAPYLDIPHYPGRSFFQTFICSKIAICEYGAIGFRNHWREWTKCNKIELTQFQPGPQPES